MNETPRPSFSLRDILAQIRRRIPWLPGKPPIVRPDPADLTKDRVRDQAEVIRRAFEKGGLGDVAIAGSDGRRPTRDAADGLYLYRPGVALVRDNTDDRRYYQEFVDFFADRGGLFGNREPVRRDDIGLPEGLVMVEMPSRSDEADAVLVTLEEIDEDRRKKGLRDVVAQPDHVLYVTGPVGHLCPATEPQVPRGTGPFPPLNTDAAAGEGVSVSVVDTGWWKAAASHPITKKWVSDVQADPEDEEQLVGSTIHEYAGHGTFVAGVVQCLAPASRVEVEGALPHGGAVYESEICEQLDQALHDDDLPNLISISAGTHTRRNLGLLGFEILMAKKGADDGVKTVVIAAAGNDGNDDPFYPAAYDWVVGVGSVDPDGKRSKFSNHGKWVNVYARGRDLVNAFCVGTYTCHYPENKTPQTKTGVPDVRKFDGLAQWSGTSFATPMVTGAIAAHMSATGNLTDPQQAYDELLQAAQTGPGGEKIIGPL